MHTKPASGASAEFEAYTGMRVSYIRNAFGRAFFAFPVLCHRLQKVSGRPLDPVRLRALFQAYDAQAAAYDKLMMSRSDAAQLAVQGFAEFHRLSEHI